jgi:hypothetical protein
MQQALTHRKGSIFKGQRLLLNIIIASGQASITGNGAN